MRNLERKKQRFLAIIDKYSNFYSYSTKEEQLLETAAVLNFVWNQWNLFWRDFWLAHVTGGIYIDNSVISPIYTNYNDKQGCHYLLYASGRRNNHTLGDSIAGNYQEISWGDPLKMANIATTMSGHFVRMTYVQSLIGVYQTKIQHFQKIRNSFIHLNNENIYGLNSIAGYYTFQPNQRLIDILESSEISTSTRCYNALINNMTGMINNL